jgi:Flp pilus assembly pilin Flp
MVRVEDAIRLATVSWTRGYSVGQEVGMVMNLLKRFLREDEGQDLVEYALLLALVVLAAASGTSIFGVSLGTLWSGLITAVSGFLGGSGG